MLYKELTGALNASKLLVGKSPFFWFVVYKAISPLILKTGTLYELSTKPTDKCGMSDYPGQTASMVCSPCDMNLPICLKALGYRICSCCFCIGWVGFDFILLCLGSTGWYTCYFGFSIGLRSFVALVCLLTNFSFISVSFLALLFISF